MGSIKRLPVVFTVLCGVAMLLLSGCLDASAPSSTSDDLRLKSTHADPRIAFLVDKMGIAEDAIHIETNGLAEGDTGYAIYPPLSEKAKRLGVLGSGVGFTARSLDKMMKKAEELEKEKKEKATQAPITLPAPASDVARSATSLAKKSHTRWDYYYSLLDVKALTEVHQVRVYIYNATKFEVGPMWTQAVRNAMANWNTQGKGTAISFVETLDSNNADLRIRGVFGLGPNYTYTHAAYMTPDHLVEDGNLYLLVNIGFEHDGVPMNQKTTAVMSLLAIGLNIGFTSMEGMFWNMGDLIHIPETPWYDGDSWTPGSSVLTYGTTSYSTPVLTAGDLAAARTLYPIDGLVASLPTPGGRQLALVYEGLTDAGAYPNTKRLQVETDTVYSTSSTGVVSRRVGAGNYSLIWSGPIGGSGADEFIFSKNHFAVRTYDGRIFTKIGGSAWTQQASGVAANSMRLDGNRLTYAYGPNRDLYDAYITTTGSTWSGRIWYGSPGLTDFRTRDGLLVIAQDGYVYAMQNFNGWHTLSDPYDPYSYGRYVRRLYLTDKMIAAYTQAPGAWYGSFSVIPGGGIYGGWYDYSYAVYSPDDIDVCGDKLAFLHNSAYPTVMNFWDWTVNDHYMMGLPNINKIRLAGENCQYVSLRDASGKLHAKFGLDLNTDYLVYHNNVNVLPTRW